MSISSSLNSGVAGLAANATRLATIADNIANASTFGYKRATVDFRSMVIDSPGNASFATGGVRVSTGRMIEARGSLISTANPTDLSVNGRGFLPVTTMTGLAAGDRPLSLVTTGSFRPDADGVLRNDAGLVLMGWPVGADGTVGAVPRDTVGALQAIRIDRNAIVANPTTQVTLAANLPAADTAAGASGSARTVSIQYFTALGGAETLTVTFAPSVPATGSTNAWTVTIEDSAAPGAPVGRYEVTFNPGPVAAGTLASVTTLTGPAWDATTGRIALPAGGGTINLALGRAGERGGLTQYDAAFTTSQIDRDGSAAASLSGIEVDAAGFLSAIYDSGFSRRLYQIPVVDVPNANGLKAADAQAFRLTPESGAMFLWDAGSGPAGTVAAFAREESGTDVASELTGLIQTQRAYASSAKVIQTVDEMLRETTNMIR